MYCTLSMPVNSRPPLQWSIVSTDSLLCSSVGGVETTTTEFLRKVSVPVLLSMDDGDDVRKRES